MVKVVLKNDEKAKTEEVAADFEIRSLRVTVA